ncbi:phosphatase PAP2 family protein [Amycolatopsis rubida]|uniref:Membrane-associated phospholipid phosphatase n=2 Tax=Amycolatopsis rubida TaxID=112413 RepID=A0A1I5V6F0_9PSEU|nr:phosphatase PAP2 family protein [Amycolatopsis rubida]SFQ03079.1 Membrane-associated phospholipid phosphatase [Amycolatopsis rubida]
MATTAGASSSETYDAITHFGLAMPGWVQSLVLAYTHYGLVLVAPFFAWLWWRARGTGSPERMAAALLVPAATVVAYVLSEIIKAFVHEQRPCRGLPPEAIVGACPPPGDWSFPSNHSTIAAAVALGGAFAWRKSAPWLTAFAATMGFSRVFVGAHYPHDVLIGLALGAGMALLSQRYALGPAAGLVRRFAGKVPFGLLGAAPGGAAATTVLAPAEEKPRRPRGAAPVRAEDAPAGSLPPRGPRPVRPADSAPRDASGRPVRPRNPQPDGRAAGGPPPRRQSSQPLPTAEPQPRPARPRQNSQPMRTAEPQPRPADAPPPNPGRPPAQPPARPARSPQPRPAGPPQGRTAGSPSPRPSNQAQAGPPPEVSPGDRPSRRTPGASRPTPPGRRNARRNA